MKKILVKETKWDSLNTTKCSLPKIEKDRDNPVSGLARGLTVQNNTTTDTSALYEFGSYMIMIEF